MTSMASLPVGRGEHAHTAALQHAAQSENIARIVIDKKNGPADEILVRIMQAFQHRLLFAAEDRRRRDGGTRPSRRDRRSGDSTPLTTTLRAIV